MIRRPLGSLAVLVSIGAFGLVTTPAEASVRWAAPGGSGAANSCSEATPCSITNAVNDPSVSDQDVIVLESGTYAITDQLAPDAPVTIRGVPGSPRPIIAADFTGSAGGKAAILITNYTEIRDLSIQVNENSDFDSAGILVSDADVVIERVRSAATGVTGSALWVGSTSSGISVVRNSIFTSAGAQPAIRTVGPPIGTSSIELIGITSRATGPVNAAHALLIPDTYGSAKVVARNSIFESANDSAIRLDSNGNADVAEIDIARSNFATPPVITGFGGDAVVSTGAGNQASAAAFVDRSAGIFTQLPTSVTLNAGTTFIDGGETDFDGDPRVLDGRPDIGADELDVQRPQTKITKAPPNRLRGSTAKIRFRSSEAGKFECKLDRSPYKRCDTPLKLKRIKLGRHLFRVRAIDLTGKKDQTPAVARFRAV